MLATPLPSTGGRHSVTRASVVRCRANDATGVALGSWAADINTAITNKEVPDPATTTDSVAIGTECPSCVVYTIPLSHPGYDTRGLASGPAPNPAANGPAAPVASSVPGDVIGADASSLPVGVPTVLACAILRR